MKKIPFFTLIFIMLSITLGLAVMSSEYSPVSRAAAPKPEQTIAGWRLFSTDTYGFQIQYPADWKLEEVEMQSEDDLLKYVLLFRPQGWQGIVAPVTVEVSAGNLDELRRLWSVLDQTNSIKINGYEAFVGTGMYDVTSRVFMHPTDEELLIAVRDNVGGAGQGSEGLSEIVQQMLATFRFN
jgi:hypothetical protein